jgi:hypothetical protein
MSLFSNTTASLEQVEILNSIFNLGPWDSHKLLMHEALPHSPGEFAALTATDADRTITYGNEIIVDAGYDPITPDSFAEGKCEDLWIEDEVAELKVMAKTLIDADEEFDTMMNDQFLEQSMDAQDIIAEMEFDEPDEDEDVPF